MFVTLLFYVIAAEVIFTIVFLSVGKLVSKAYQKKNPDPEDVVLVESNKN